jgi:adenosylcobyric acid synthase
VRGFVINKFRGDPVLLRPGLAELEARTGVPTLGVLPFVAGLDLDAEDSLALAEFTVPPRPSGAGGPGAAAAIDVAVVRLPRISNFTDFDALGLEPGVSVRYVEHPAALGTPDLAVIPGSKATVSDLAWLRGRCFVDALRRCGCVLGICGGYQMLGRTIHDPVESGQGTVEGIGWLDVETRFDPSKITRQRRGTALGHRVTGYQIHHGRTGLAVAGSAPGVPAPATGWVHLDDAWGEGHDGAASADGRVLGTTLHGLFESDGFRAAFLADVAARRGKVFTPAGVSFRAAREAQFDRLADLLEAHLDMAAVEGLIAAGARELTP